MNRIKLLIGILILICLNNNNKACSCIGKDSVKIALKKSDVVITGQVINIEEVIIPYSLPGKKTVINNYYKKVTFKLNTIFKGKLKTDKIAIITKIGNGDCGFHFKKGFNYLIYGTYKRKYFETGEKVTRYIYTDICTRTTSNIDLESSEIKKIIRRYKHK